MNRVRMKWILMLGLSLVMIDVSIAEEIQELTIDGETVNVTLTGIPQIDYIHDPNLPRELNGYDLSNYPFLNSMPKNLTFKCDGRHDGFYASVEWNCQVYHQCLFGIRYDFICANFTSFDQKNFICTFASDVDCPNSEKFFDRNEALYKTTTTTTEPNPFLSVLRNQRPRRPHPQLARLRGDRIDAFDDAEDEDYDLPIIPKQRAEESKPRFIEKTEAAPVAQPVSSNKVAQDLQENTQAEAEIPARGVAGPGRLRAIKQHRRRPGKRRRPFRPAFYDYYDYYDDLYDDVPDDEYDYDYASNVRLANRRPGQRRPNKAKGGAAPKAEIDDEPPTPALKEKPGKQPVPEVSLPAVVEEKKNQVLPTPSDRKRLFQQRDPPKLRVSAAEITTKTSTTVSTTTKAPTTQKETSETPEIEYYYDYEYEDEIDNESADTQAKITTVKTESVPKLQPAFRRAGLPERQVRTEDPIISSTPESIQSSKNRGVEEIAGAAKLRNRLQTLRVKDSQPQRNDEEQLEAEQPEPIVIPQLTTEQTVTKRRIQRPPSATTAANKVVTEAETSSQRNIEVTTFRAQKSRKLNVAVSRLSASQ